MEVIRIAMWSGPRNVSTALMRSFSSRSDTDVVDEPLYAAYLAETGLDHPGREEILATYPTAWAEAVAALEADTTQPVQYAKHMTHHLLPSMDRGWIPRMRNAFLIRNPDEVLASYTQVIAEPTLEDLGMPQQQELFDLVRAETGAIPPVVDARDLLEDPPRVLAALCERLGLPFEDRMLNWSAGPHPRDGCWAPHWYAKVEASTGFGPYRPKDAPLDERLQPLAARCRPYYDHLHAHRIR